MRAVLHVDLVDVVDELHDLLVRQILVEPAAELRREVVLAVRERTSTTKPRMMLHGLQPMQLLTLPAEIGQTRW